MESTYLPLSEKEEKDCCTRLYLGINRMLQVRFVLSTRKRIMSAFASHQLDATCSIRTCASSRFPGNARQSSHQNAGASDTHNDKLGQVAGDKPYKPRFRA